MSLLEEAMEDFIFMNKAVVDDGYGGTTTVWSEGAIIKGAIPYSNSLGTQIAQALGSTSVYQLTVRKDTELDFHDVLKRVKDGKIFRITNNADDYKTPNSAGLNMRQYTAEEWSLPT